MPLRFGNSPFPLQGIQSCRELLYNRKKALEEYFKSIDRMSNDSIFLDQNNRAANLKDLAQSVKVLQSEAAKIHVLAKTIRAL